MSTGPRAYNILRGYINREWDRLSNMDLFKAEQELDEPLPTTSSQPAATPNPEQTEARARSVLGVSADADYAEIRKAYESLFERSDPNRFSEGSMERAQATQIHAKVERAFRLLSKSADATEQRFRSLEID